MAVKITQLELENIKRVKAVRLEPSADGLTIIGGRNGQGKTSVLDAIAWALGGERYKPEGAARDGSVLPPKLRVALSNGLVVERDGKNGELKVIDPAGKKSGQALLTELVGELAINLPKFMAASSRDKADVLLRIIGVGDKLAVLERDISAAYTQRVQIGRIADQKLKAAKELPCYPEAPDEPVSASALIRQQQDILARNGENARLRRSLQQLTDRDAALTEQIDRLVGERNRVRADLAIAQRSAEDLHDESTEELERSIEQVEEINRKVRVNLDKIKAKEDAGCYATQYAGMTERLEQLRADKRALLDGAALPLPELSVEDGELTYKGHRWGDMAGSEQLVVATAICAAVNPKCGFVLMDKLEQMDTDTLRDFGDWLEAHGLQAIATRVSTGGECSVIIEDGSIVGTPKETAPAWSGLQEGDF